VINYQVELKSPQSHYLKVTLNYSSRLHKGQVFWLPDWIPGSYMIRDFARNIVSINANDDGKSIELTKVGKSSWSLSKDVNQITIDYTIYAWDLSVRSAHFDDQHCFFNGTSVFLALKGKEQLEHQVLLESPGFDLAVEWQVATAMKPVKINQNGFGLYSSNDYAELIDHPFEIASWSMVEFKVNGVAHQMVFTEMPNDVDLKRIAADVEKICSHQCKMFDDSKPPFDSYLFMTFVLKNGFGGLEHRSSTALHCSHADLPKRYDDKEEKSTDYQRFLALCSHEYFHSWNVKRIKPKAFEDYRLSEEVHTELLWFFEGVTSYYDELVLVRAGVITLEQYLDMLAKNITRYMRGWGRTKQTVTESSFDAWSKFYKQDENAVNAVVSYYVKGGLIAMLLDFKIQELTNNSKNLDDLMRLIWNRIGKPQSGVSEQQIQKLTEELCGQSLTSFFKRVLYSTEELALENLFDKLGVSFHLVSEVKQLEVGGYVESFETRVNKCSLGVIAKSHPMGAEIISVYEGSSAAKAGLSNKDILIAINHYRVTFEELDKAIAKYPVGQSVTLSFFRRDKLHQRECGLNSLVPNVCFLSYDKQNIHPNLTHWLQLDSGVD
jgi:predicted metalloprotease with PDZ domain